MNQDHNIAWLRKRIRLSARDMQGTWSTEASGIPQGAVTAGVTELKVGAAGVVGFEMAAGEFITGAIPIPSDLDPDKPIGFKVHYTGNHDGAGDATVSWILLIDTKKEGIAIAVAATALDTIIALLDAYTDDGGTSVVTDWLYQVSGRGIKNSIGLTRVDIEKGAVLMVKLEMDAMVNFTTGPTFLWLDMDYAIMKTQGFGSHLDQPLQSDGQA